MAALLATLAACQKTEAPAAKAATPVAVASAATAAAAPAPAAAAKVAVADMSADQLRQAALTAMSENRLYSPAGDNAIEYYIALRNKFPNDPNISGALIDLAPYTSIAVGQSVSRNDFNEAERLTALIDKIDANYPALSRLHQNIAEAKDAFLKKQTQTADAQQRLAQQQAAAEQQAAQQKAAQQKAALATVAPPKPVEEQPAPSRPVAVVPAPVAAPPPVQAPQPRAAAASTELVVLSAPSPRYPPDALRANVSGEVLLEMTVGTDGSVTDAEVVRSTPPRVFDRAALTAVKRWKFAPIAAATVTRRTINFKSN